MLITAKLPYYVELQNNVSYDEGAELCLQYKKTQHLSVFVELPDGMQLTFDVSRAESRRLSWDALSFAFSVNVILREGDKMLWMGEILWESHSWSPSALYAYNGMPPRYDMRAYLAQGINHLILQAKKGDIASVAITPVDCVLVEEFEWDV